MKHTETPTSDRVESKKQQFNYRLPPNAVRRIKAIAALSGMSLEQVAEDVWRFYFGENDKLLKTRRAYVLSASKKLKREANDPFEMPLIPFTNNALTA